MNSSSENSPPEFRRGNSASIGDHEEVHGGGISSNPAAARPAIGVCSVHNFPVVQDVYPEAKIEMAVDQVFVGKPELT